MESNSIVVMIQPFDMMQKIFIVESGQVKREESATFNELPEALLALCKSYNTTQVNIQGDPNFSEKIYKKLEELNTESKEEE